MVECGEKECFFFFLDMFFFLLTTVFLSKENTQGCGAVREQTGTKLVDCACCGQQLVGRDARELK